MTAREVRTYTALVPAGTLPGAPATFDMSFPPRVVTRIEINVPPGPSGLVGFAVQCSHVTVIPYLTDSWIITDDEKIAWDLTDQPTSGSWQLVAYNAGGNDHTIFVRFLLDIVPGPGSSLPPMMDNHLLTNSPN